MDEFDEVKLSVAIDLAKELAGDYPYADELDEAEDYLYELMQCPVESFGKSPSSSVPQPVKPLPAAADDESPQATDEAMNYSS